MLDAEARRLPSGEKRTVLTACSWSSSTSSCSPVRSSQTRTGGTHPVARAIAWLREHFEQTMRVDELAKRIGMSRSGLHSHFRAVTGMSPLQYQKTLRLHEARRILVAEDIDTATAGFRVGYNDQSQFTREYRRLFGAPPLRDLKRLRAASDAGRTASALP
ncbi:AraC family transcriptional regulator [Nannocystis sp. ILAH1]|nr:AraC family transcriptional regulator [Nannocystis sp. ILAH1]